MTIKSGDLVMVMRPACCCGETSGMGNVFVAGWMFNTGDRYECTSCGDDRDITVTTMGNGEAIEVSRLKKIDPPAEGDSLPTRADIEVTA